jgi:hypothetical protein
MRDMDAFGLGFAVLAALALLLELGATGVADTDATEMLVDMSPLHSQLRNRRIRRSNIRRLY